MEALLGSLNLFVTYIKTLLVKTIKPGAVWPVGYGFAWFNPTDGTISCLPIGLNSIVSGVRAWYFGVVQGFRSQRETYTFKIGSVEGQRQGYSVGYYHGYSDAKAGQPNKLMEAAS